MTKDYKGEEIYVFNEEYMSRFKKLPGLSVNSDDLLEMAHICQKHGYFFDRTKAEKDPTKKQVIPYILITRGDKLFTYQRSSKSGENRLHDKWSIGVGGHINPEDDINLGFQSMISMTINREIKEELDWGNDFNQTINNIRHIGILYDPSNSVGEVHIGSIYTINLDDEGNVDYPKAQENTIKRFEWKTPEELFSVNLENWSEIMVQALNSENDNDYI